MSRNLLALVLGLSLFACGGGEASNAPPTSPSSGSLASNDAAPQTFAEQVTHGERLYAAQCAGCHGPSGQGGRAPAVVGLANGALPLEPPPTAKYRKAPFKTVADVGDFVAKSMPPKSPGSLSPEAYWSIMAFDLKANGIDLGDKKLTPELASTLEIPRR